MSQFSHFELLHGRTDQASSQSREVSEHTHKELCTAAELTSSSVKLVSSRTSTGKGRGACNSARGKRAHTAPLGSSCSFSADPTYDPSEVFFERMSSSSLPIQYQLSAECCLRDFFQSFYEGPFAKLPDQGGPPRISGVTQYVITDLLQALSSCQVHTADDLMAMLQDKRLAARVRSQCRPDLYSVRGSDAQIFCLYWFERDENRSRFVKFLQLRSTTIGALHATSRHQPSPKNSRPITSFLISKMHSDVAEASPDTESAHREEVALLLKASNSWFDDRDLRSIAASKLMSPAHHTFNSTDSNPRLPVATFSKRPGADVPEQKKRRTVTLLPPNFSPPPPPLPVWKPPPAANWTVPEVYKPETFVVASSPKSYPGTVLHPNDADAVHGVRQLPVLRDPSAMTKLELEAELWTVFRKKAPGLALKQLAEHLRECRRRAPTPPTLPLSSHQVDGRQAALEVIMYCRQQGMLYITMDDVELALQRCGHDVRLTIAYLTNGRAHASADRTAAPPSHSSDIFTPVQQVMSVCNLEYRDAEDLLKRHGNDVYDAITHHLDEQPHSPKISREEINHMKAVIKRGVRFISEPMVKFFYKDDCLHPHEHDSCPPSIPQEIFDDLTPSTQHGVRNIVASRMIHRLASSENNQCLYFALLGALQHSGRAMHYDHRTLKEAILNHMVTNSSKANYFINSAGAYRVERDCPDERFETLQEALRAEPHIGFPFNEPFTTMERYRQVMSQDMVYGTHLEIMGAAALFRVRVIVWIPNHGTFQFYGRRDHPYIYLITTDGRIHYDWLEPQE